MLRSTRGIENAESPESNTDDATAGLLKERSALRAQIAQLEIALALSKPSGSRPASTDEPDEDGFEDLVPALEQFDLNIQSETNHTDKMKARVVRQLWDPVNDPLYMLLPSRRASTCIVTYSLQTLGWIHCAVRADQFLGEHEKFWDSIESGHTVEAGSRPWIALYFSLLAVGLLYMQPDHIPHAAELPHSMIPGSNNNTDNSTGVARMWYEAALKELERSGFLKQASLTSIQALVVLTLCNSNFGEHQQELLLMGLAINMARCLNMHRLGSEATYSRETFSSTPEWSTVAERELGRRLWWTLVVCDW